jgi:DNA-binding NtrC family response regulator
MLDGLNILIAEDDRSASAELSFAVDHMDGRVTGPVATIADALDILDTQPVDAAILDANLLDGDVTPLAQLLLRRQIPFVVYTGSGLPAALAARYPDLPTVMKPTATKQLLAELLRQIDIVAASQDRTRAKAA